MAGGYLSEIVPDEEIKRVYEILQGTDPSSLSTLSSFYQSNLDALNTSFTSAAS
jgi:RNA polymerase-interacting CarD/CdnL/TRCF family regulator